MLGQVGHKPPYTVPYVRWCERSVSLYGSPPTRLCVRYVTKLGGESPLRTLVRGTVREGKGVHREVESEESRIQIADLTNRKRI